MKMLRIVGAVALLCTAVCGQMPISPENIMSQYFGPNCTVEDQHAIFGCNMNMQNQTEASQAVFQQYGNVFITGIITEQEAKAILDAACNLITGLVDCVRPFASRCFTTPLTAMSFAMYDDLLEICAAPSRYRDFVEVVRCNKKLDVYNTVANDQQLGSIINEIVNITTQSLGPNSNISAVMDMPPEVYTNIFCRMIRRVEEIVPLEKVNATCGAEAHSSYLNLYPHILEMYHCNGDHSSQNSTTAIVPPITTSPNAETSEPSIQNSTLPVVPPITTNPNAGSSEKPVSSQSSTPPALPPTTSNPNAASFVYPGNGFILYTLFATLFGMAVIHRRD